MTVTIKNLTAVGNSLGLIIERPILDLLDIDKETPLEVRTDGELWPANWCCHGRVRFRPGPSRPRAHRHCFRPSTVTAPVTHTAPRYSELQDLHYRR